MRDFYTAPQGAGSVIAIVATDAPFFPSQCKSLARRVSLGLARTGTIGSHSSGDIFLAVSTANEGAFSRKPPKAPNAPKATKPQQDRPGYGHLEFIPWDAIDPFYTSRRPGHRRGRRQRPDRQRGHDRPRRPPLPGPAQAPPSRDPVQNPEKPESCLRPATYQTRAAGNSCHYDDGTQRNAMATTVALTFVNAIVYCRLPCVNVVSGECGNAAYVGSVPSCLGERDECPHGHRRHRQEVAGGDRRRRGVRRHPQPLRGVHRGTDGQARPLDRRRGRDARGPRHVRLLLGRPQRAGATRARNPSRRKRRPALGRPRRLDRAGARRPRPEGRLRRPGPDPAQAEHRPALARHQPLGLRRAHPRRARAADPAAGR